jgi:hypothetical protein
MSPYLERRTTMLVLFGAAMLGGIAVALRPRRDLLSGKPWRTSSVWEGWSPERARRDAFAPTIFFHTVEEENPFIEFDLGVLTMVRKLRVENRSDGGHQLRAVPLIALTSTDGDTWIEVARQPYWFQTWEAQFQPREARYFRLQVPKRTTFHLEAVELW